MANDTNSLRVRFINCEAAWLGHPRGKGKPTSVSPENVNREPAILHSSQEFGRLDYLILNRKYIALIMS